MVLLVSLGVLVLAPVTGVTAEVGAAREEGPGSAHTTEVEIHVTLPEVDWMEVPAEAAEAVNEAIRSKGLALIEELAPFGNVWGEHRVHVDRDGVLSLTLAYSGFREHMAHPMHYRASVTADLREGKVYSLADLFGDERYLERLSRLVADEIEKGDAPTLVEFEQISPDQDFYLTQDALVLYFQLYELRPYAWGFPEFKIPFDVISDIARDDGPVGRLAAPR